MDNIVFARAVQASAQAFAAKLKAKDNGNGAWTLGVSGLDPLAGLMQWRLQTHNGDNVPLGLWQDSGGTVPALAEGDPVALWTDQITSSGLRVGITDSETQSGLASLKFLNGVPTIYSPFLLYPSQAWFPSKRGALYSSAARNLSTTASGDLGNTLSQGASNPFLWYATACAFAPVNFVQGLYDGSSRTIPQADFGWDQRAFVRNADATWQFWRNGLLESTPTASNVQQGSSAMQSQYYGNVVAILYATSGTFIPETATYLASISPSNPAWTTLIRCPGDSLTAGNGSTGLGNWPAQLQARYNFNTTGVKNIGVPSATIANAASNSAFVDGNWPSSITRKVVCAWMGTNTLFFGATANDTYNQYVAYCQARQAAGAKVVAFTILLRDDAGTPGTFDTDRLAVNALIVATFATFADALADVASISQLSNPDNATYYADHVHLTNAGYALVAPVVKTAIDSIP